MKRSRGWSCHIAAIVFTFTALLSIHRTIVGAWTEGPLKSSDFNTRRSVVHSYGLGEPTYIKNVISTRPSLDTYAQMRKDFFRYEKSRGIGADIELNDREIIANHIIMTAKNSEIEEGLISPHLFNPSHHLFSVLDRIRRSKLFKYLTMMPKGGVLHAHDAALCSTDFLLELTYRKNLWICYTRTKGIMHAEALRFSLLKPATDVSGANCSWVLVSDLRDIRGRVVFDRYLRKRFTLYPVEKYEDNNAAWKQFIKIFRLLNGLLQYAPVWRDYYYNALKEYYTDGVQYLEFRTTLPILYDLNGNNYTSIDTARIYKETVDEFIAANPGFIGSKLIYAPNRNVDDSGMKQYIETAIALKTHFPTFFAGFDLVGQEEMGRPLRDYLPQLLAMPDNIDFYFHAGETNWFGSSTDENLIDAVLLGTKRIGHGYALLKHPNAMAMVKDRNIAVEVNPISNQILQLVADYRNHPCSHLFADNFPVVISSDDPSFWKASPLSHDFYIAFLGIASAHSDIRLLKQLAINSITYSAMNAAEKEVAFGKWQTQWDVFIDNLLARENSTSTRGLFTNHVD